MKSPLSLFLLTLALLITVIKNKYQTSYCFPQLMERTGQKKKKQYYVLVHSTQELTIYCIKEWHLQADCFETGQFQMQNMLLMLSWLEWKNHSMNKYLNYSSHPALHPLNMHFRCVCKKQTKQNRLKKKDATRT